MNILIIHPSGQFNGSAFYLQDISEFAVKKGHQVKILCEGKIKSPTLNGIAWSQIKFSGCLVDEEQVNEVKSFAPTHMICVGVRSNVMRTSLQLLYNLKTIFIVQAEDDEYEPFLLHSPYNNTDILDASNIPNITLKGLYKLYTQLNFDFSYKTISDPRFSRWVEPLMRALCYWRANSIGCIWFPMERRVYTWFDKNTFIFPPLVSSPDIFKSIKEIDREKFLKEKNIDPNKFIIFISGSIYGYSKEFEVFLESLKLFSEKINKKISFIIAGKSAKYTEEEIIQHIGKNVQFFNFGLLDNSDYLLFNKYSDLIAAPGFSDQFNEYRLSSRLVKALLLGKKIFTFKIGFGESIAHLPYTYLTETDNVNEWVLKLESAYNDEYILEKSKNLSLYAEKYFCVEKIGDQILADISNSSSKVSIKVFLGVKAFNIFLKLIHFVKITKRLFLKK